MQVDLSPKEYVAELLSRGYVEYRPKVGRRKISPTYIISRNTKFVIAAQLDNQNSVHMKKRNSTFEMYIPSDKHSKITLAYFPTNVDHAQLFSESEVRPNGPSEYLPGSVAALSFLFQYYQKETFVDYLQYCFKQGSPQNLTRNITSKYLGARKRLLTSLFDLDIVMESKWIHFIRMLNRGNNKSDLEEVIQKNKKINEIFEVHEDTLYTRNPENFY